MVWPVDRSQRAQSLKRRVHFSRGRLLTLLDERVQQHRFAFKDREKHASEPIPNRLSAPFSPEEPSRQLWEVT